MPHLLFVLDQLVEGHVVNQIRVSAEVRKWALAALDRMLTITAQASEPAESPLPVD